MVGGTGGYGKDGVAQAWGARSLSEDGLFLEVARGHNVEGKWDGALAVGGGVIRVGAVGVVVWRWGESEEGKTSEDGGNTSGFTDVGGKVICVN